MKKITHQKDCDTSIVNHICHSYKQNKKDKLSLKTLLTSSHLISIHSALFKDDYYYNGGMLRSNSNHSRERIIQHALKEEANYSVFYCPNKPTKEKIDEVLSSFYSSFSSLKNEFCLKRELSLLDSDREEISVMQDKTAKLLSNLYSQLDFIHPFEDGNSRTIREFVRQVAHNIGCQIDYSKTNVNEKTREQFYLARDYQVLSLGFPNLTQQALKDLDLDRTTILAYTSLSFLKKNIPHIQEGLQDIFKKCLSIKQTKLVKVDVNNFNTSNVLKHKV